MQTEIWGGGAAYSSLALTGGGRTMAEVAVAYERLAPYTYRSGRGRGNCNGNCAITLTVVALKSDDVALLPARPRPALAWYTDGPANFGCPGVGLPLESSNSSCWPRTLALIGHHRVSTD